MEAGSEGKYAGDCQASPGAAVGELSLGQGQLSRPTQSCSQIEISPEFGSFSGAFLGTFDKNGKVLWHFKKNWELFWSFFGCF